MNFNSIEFNIYFRAILTAVLIAINDIGIKLYAGGIHDAEGQGVTNVLLLAGVVPCFLILIFCVIKTKDVSVFNKIASVLVFLLLICLHLYFFSDLGLDQSYL